MQGQSGSDDVVVIKNMSKVHVCTCILKDVHLVTCTCSTVCTSTKHIATMPKIAIHVCLDEEGTTYYCNIATYTYVRVPEKHKAVATLITILYVRSYTMHIYMCQEHMKFFCLLEKEIICVSDVPYSFMYAHAAHLLRRSIQGRLLAVH